MKLYLIRHGETDWNLEDRFQGQEDIPLNQTGLQQAQTCGDALKDIPFRCIQTSPLSRARKTAELIAARQNCPLIVNPDLIERDYGRLSGLTPTQRKSFEKLGIPNMAEPWDRLAARTFQAVEALAKQYPQETLALISHGAWINALLAVISNHEIGTGKTNLKNACISLLCKSSKGWSIEFFNITAESLMGHGTTPKA